MSRFCLRSRCRLDESRAFSLWFVLDNKGTLRAQYGTAAHLEREFAWRDYFIGAQGLSDDQIRQLHAYLRARAREVLGLRQAAAPATDAPAAKLERPVTY